MTPSSSFQRRYLALVVTATLVAMLMGAGTVGAVPSGSVDVQLLAINDFHGNLEPPSGSSGRILTPTGNVNAGGIAYLATHIKALEAMNSLGLDFNAVGNHEFDEGGAELLRMQNGGCHPTDGCLDGDGFAGADFQFLAANVVREDNGKTVFPAYKMRSFAGAKIAFIGVVLEGTPTIVTPAGVAGLDFLDEASTVNALVPGLKAKGIETIVVLIHEGGFQTGLYDQCTGISGPVFDIVNALDDEGDVVISGHTHQAYDS